MSPSCRTMPPIIWTSNRRCPDSRLRASRTAANASKRTSSSDSPFSRRCLNSAGLREQLGVRQRLEVRLERGDVRRLLGEALEAPAFADAQHLLEAAEARGRAWRRGYRLPVARPRPRMIPNDSLTFPSQRGADDPVMRRLLLSLGAPLRSRSRASPPRPSRPAARSTNPSPDHRARRRASLGRLRGARDSRPKRCAYVRALGHGDARSLDVRSGDDAHLQGGTEHRERHLVRSRPPGGASSGSTYGGREHPRVRPLDGDAEAHEPAPARRGVERRRLRRSAARPRRRARARASRTPSATTITYVADDGRRLFRVSRRRVPCGCSRPASGRVRQRVVASLADGRVVVLSKTGERGQDERLRARDGDRRAARASRRHRPDGHRRSRRVATTVALARRRDRSSTTARDGSSTRRARRCARVTSRPRPTRSCRRLPSRPVGKPLFSTDAWGSAWANGTAVSWRGGPLP